MKRNKKLAVLLLFLPFQWPSIQEYNDFWGLGTKYDVGSCIDSLLSAVIAKKSKQNIAKDEYLNLLFHFFALFVSGEERKKVLLGTTSYVTIRSKISLDRKSLHS